MRRRTVLWIVGGFMATGAVIVGVANAIVLLGAGSAGHDPARAPHAQVALVLGAFVQPDGRPSAMLADRLDAAAALYRDRRVDRVHGIAADRSGYGLEGGKSKVREVLARVKAVEDVVTKVKPRFLGPKVPITGSAEASRG
jgi:vancomycin permeability regulator SanA